MGMPGEKVHVVSTCICSLVCKGNQLEEYRVAAIIHVDFFLFFFFRAEVNKRSPTPINNNMENPTRIASLERKALSNVSLKCCLFVYKLVDGSIASELNVQRRKKTAGSLNFG